MKCDTFSFQALFNSQKETDQKKFIEPNSTPYYDGIVIVASLGQITGTVDFVLLSKLSNYSNKHRGFSVD